MGMADMMNGYYKVSMRISGRKNDVDLRDIVKRVTDKVGGEAGGHTFAAGAMIKEEDADEFVKVAKEVLGKHGLEEVVH